MYSDEYNVRFEAIKYIQNFLLLSLADAAGLLLVLLLAQMLAITLFSVAVVFRVMGRDYDAAVISAGFVGMGLGATPVAIANMDAITRKYGLSTKAFLIVPLVGAFFIDLTNALVIKFFLGLPFWEQYRVLVNRRHLPAKK